ncbi:hypothetical protein [Turicimonas muris]|uniref:Uncharacterized protein n=4 Tax=Turicimonas muris TaxID=1796652 RepID=A0A227KRZ1_9BURK|nr:hypothetical protein [Turicimonas muris]ANU65451.1 hypothetical protein A4V04_02660 [Burkholderiales bacterium YL45]MBS4769376.1 hypothetical protein [Burkholderiales bacterium]OXE51259.1 hypothetical protein ADH67_02900 [Turicimonas muris]QQQ96599.1 hypothetical protein I5Q81_11785 [Turicimonas muris]
MATRRSKKTTEFESLPIQVPLSIDTFAAIVDAGRVMEDSIKYIDDPLMRSETIFISHSILEQGQMGLKDIEIARDPKRQSEKSTSRALVPLPFFMAIAFGVRLFTNYLTTSLPKMPEEKKTASLKTLNDSLTEFEKAKLEGIKDQDKIARMMQQLIEQIGENPDDLSPLDIDEKKNSIN